MVHAHFAVMYSINANNKTYKVHVSLPFMAL